MKKETIEEKILKELTDEKLSAKIKKMEDNTMIAHYTTMEGLVGLLNSGTLCEGKMMLKMWATNIYALNDPTELLHGYDIIQEWLPKIESELNVNDKDRLSNIWKNYATGEKPDSYYNNLLKESLYNQEYSAYILSFSRKMDDLAMLRMYSQEATGVCLVLSSGMVQEACNLYDVCYDEKFDNIIFTPFEMFKTVYKQYLNRLREKQLNNKEKFKFMLNHLVTYIMLIAPYIKRSDYSYEEEIRFAKPYKITDDIKFRTNRNGNLIPYIEVNIPFKAIEKIIIGPCANYNVSKYVIEQKLKSMGISDIPKIVKSEKEYRIY